MTTRAGRSFWAGLAGLMALACGHPPDAVTPTIRVGAVDTNVAPATSAVPEPNGPLFADESALERELASLGARWLALGERTLRDPFSLARATDFIALTLEGYGFAVDRQGFMLGAEPVENLEVTVAGATSGQETIVIGARYDAPRSQSTSESFDAVVLLLLAKHWAIAHPNRSLRLVWFANGAEPQTLEERGSFRYASQRYAAGAAATLAVILHDAGVSQPCGSASTAAGAEQPFRVWGRKADTEMLLEPLERDARLEPLLLSEAEQSACPTDQLSFVARSHNVLLFSEQLPQCGCRTTAPVDYVRLARFTAALTSMSDTWLGKAPEKTSE